MRYTEEGGDVAKADAGRGGGIPFPHPRRHVAYQLLIGLHDVLTRPSAARNLGKRQGRSGVVRKKEKGGGIGSENRAVGPWPIFT